MYSGEQPQYGFETRARRCRAPASPGTARRILLSLRWLTDEGQFWAVRPPPRPDCLRFGLRAPPPGSDGDRRADRSRWILQRGDRLREIRFGDRAARDERFTKFLESEAQEMRREWMPAAHDGAPALGAYIDESQGQEVSQRPSPVFAFDRRRRFEVLHRSDDDTTQRGRFAGFVDRDEVGLLDQYRAARMERRDQAFER